MTQPKEERPGDTRDPEDHDDREQFQPDSEDHHGAEEVLRRKRKHPEGEGRTNTDVNQPRDGEPDGD
jgi:hypothetical protein